MPCAITPSSKCLLSLLPLQPSLSLKTQNGSTKGGHTPVTPEAGRPRALGEPQLHGEPKVRLEYTRPCLKNKKEAKKVASSFHMLGFKFMLEDVLSCPEFQDYA